MITEDALGRQVAGQLEDPVAVGPAVDQVPDEDEAVRFLRFEGYQQLLQFLHAPVDIADKKRAALGGGKAFYAQGCHCIIDTPQ